MMAMCGVSCVINEKLVYMRHNKVLVSYLPHLYIKYEARSSSWLV